VGSNPASPSLGFFRGLLRSEELPEGWWGSWVGQVATESLRIEVFQWLQKDRFCGTFKN